jgi:ketosteroid isomerase-like protein
MSINIENTKKAYAAFSAGDIATVIDLITPDCVWHVGGRSAAAGTYVGHDQILGYFAKLMELSEGTFKVDLLDVAELPATRMVISLVNSTVIRNGATIDVRMVQLSREDEAGHLAECWWFSEDQYLQDASLGAAEIVLPTQAGVTARA